MEADIIYGAVFDNEKTVAFHAEFIQKMENKLTGFYFEGKDIQEIIGLYQVENINCTVYHDMKKDLSM